MTGQTVSVVETSNVAGFEVGDLVLASAGWQDYSLSGGRDQVTKIDPTLARGRRTRSGCSACRDLPPTWACSTSASRRPGETIVVAAATGAVGLAGRADRQAQGLPRGRRGRRREKCDYAVETSGSMPARPPRARARASALAAACPKGIDVYFENVGGAVLAAVVPLLNSARACRCAA